MDNFYENLVLLGVGCIYGIFLVNGKIIINMGFNLKFIVINEIDRDI